MGCDGGTIPKRVEMIKLKKKRETVKKEEALMAKWRHCAISSQPLREPIVACYQGILYNKESVIEALLDAAKMPELAQHIKSLKDVTVLTLSKNPSLAGGKKNGDSFEDAQSSEFICSVTGLEMTGMYRFVFLKSCSCVLSERALKEAPSETCHSCGKPFSARDVFVLNGEEEDMKRQSAVVEEAKKQLKLAKKKKRAALQSEPSTDNGDCNGDESSMPGAKRIKPVPTGEELPKDSPIMLNSAASLEGSKVNGPLPGKVDRPHKPAKKVSTVASNSGSKVKGSAKVVVDSVARTLSDLKSVADDPSARKVYKSIFNSSHPPQKHMGGRV